MNNKYKHCSENNLFRNNQLFYLFIYLFASATPRLIFIHLQTFREAFNYSFRLFPVFSGCLNAPRSLHLRMNPTRKALSLITSPLRALSVWGCSGVGTSWSSVAKGPFYGGWRGGKGVGGCWERGCADAALIQCEAVRTSIV